MGTNSEKASAFAVEGSQHGILKEDGHPERGQRVEWV